MFSQNPICKLLGIPYPIIQGGMVWVSGGRLAAAVSQAGGLGLIGAGSMDPHLLGEHIQKAQSLTQKPFGVNIPILYSKVEEQIEKALSLGVRIFVTSAGSPKKFTQGLKNQGCTVLHVASSPKLALSCQEAGVDAVIGEGFEAGGHNGRDELTTFTLIPQMADALGSRTPVIAAGGIGDGRGMVAALALGAQGIQMGTRFLATQESSAHEAFKEAVLQASPTDTVLCMKELVPVRLLKNPFYEKIKKLEDDPTHTKEALEQLLGKGRARLGMLQGDLVEGELEVGQISGFIRDLPTVQELMTRIIKEYKKVERHLATP
jgi:enoyl-[acyl-carrier protein] reductase II